MSDPVVSRTSGGLAGTWLRNCCFGGETMTTLVKYFLPQEDPSRLWTHYFIFLYSVHGREDRSRLWHETESGYMVTSFDSINIEVLDKVHICSIPTIAMLEMWEKLGQWV